MPSVLYYAQPHDHGHEVFIDQSKDRIAFGWAREKCDIVLSAPPGWFIHPLHFALRRNESKNWILELVDGAAVFVDGKVAVPGQTIGSDNIIELDTRGGPFLVFNPVDLPTFTGPARYTRRAHSV
ncbi:FHA domain-containing protein [Variibacter gotjawalensis]|uniref:FHA domain-containing protein n=1 Tax=Variibacter gotjawalensis TaxID=1333996 RepID=UPI00102B01E6|nr:FHA domain-containing protein [Variibacter gotjawalensis]NIK49741.1 hypothetical protein [Variibacter gotjawalensis]